MKRSAHENNVAVSMKHFPGGSVDEVDQHLLASVNTMPIHEWEATYGKVYRSLIEDGAMSFMLGHIDHPAWRQLLIQQPGNPGRPGGKADGSGYLPGQIAHRSFLRERILAILRSKHV